MKSKSNKSPHSLAYAADPTGTLKGILLGSLGGYWQFSDLRSEFGYEQLCASLTETMRDSDIHKRFSGDTWSVEKSAIPELPAEIISLLLMPSILSGIQNLSSAISHRGSLKGYVASERLEIIDLFIASDYDVYRTAEVIGALGDHWVKVYIDRIEECQKELESQEGKLVRTTTWYQKSVNFTLRTDAVSKVVVQYLFKQGPGGNPSWAYNAAFNCLQNMFTGVSHRDFLNAIDAFFSTKDLEGVRSAEFAPGLNKIYSKLLQRLVMTNGSKQSKQDSNSEHWWILQAIREFHRLFHTSGAKLIEYRREHPQDTKVQLAEVLRLLNGTPTYDHMSVVAEYVSTITGDGVPYRSGSGTMKDALLQVAHIPENFLNRPAKDWGLLKASMQELFKGPGGEKKVREAIEKTSSGHQAIFFAKIFPSMILQSKNAWIRDQIMSTDLGL